MPRKRESYFLYIVESPSGGDLFSQQTEGNLLLEGLRLAQVPSPINTRLKYRLVVNEESFDRAMLVELPAILKELRGVTPILHLSMHGDTSGLQLTDNTDISWKEFGKLLCDLNKDFANGKLIVCVSACKGIYGGMMQLDDRRKRPFKALIGPWNEPLWADAAVAYLTFYHLLMNKGRSLKTSVKAMKMASGNKKFDYVTPDSLLASVRHQLKKRD